VIVGAMAVVLGRKIFFIFTKSSNETDEKKGIVFGDVTSSIRVWG